jgi:RNA polymerase sigma factor (sigma-70 family)
MWRSGERRGDRTEALTMDEPSFAELVERARLGDPQAARLLVERYESAIRRQVRSALRDNRLRRRLGETDVCQSVLGQFFVALWAGRLAFDGPEQLVALLKEMVHNKVVGKARYWGAGRRDYRRELGPLDSDHAVEPLSPGPTPSRIVADAELLAEFERRLSEPERAILLLRQQGASWAEVAERVGGSPGAIRKRYERALDRVGRELGLDE